jgi:hypothetical protein
MSFNGLDFLQTQNAGWPEYLKAEDEMSSKIDLKKTGSFWSKA